MKFKSWIFLVCSFLFLVFCCGCDRSPKDEITIYTAYYGKNGDLFSVHSVKYKIDFDSQLVIYWHPGEPPNKLGNCVVRNRDKWTGEYFDGGATLSMVNGKLETIPPHDLFNSRQVTFERYQILKKEIDNRQ